MLKLHKNDEIHIKKRNANYWIYFSCTSTSLFFISLTSSSFLFKFGAKRIYDDDNDDDDVPD